MNAELKRKLHALGLRKTIAFCDHCQRWAPAGPCEHCGSGDLMRLLPGVGSGHGTDWVVAELAREAATPIDLEAEYQRCLSETHPEPVTICGLTFDPADAFQRVDPAAYRRAQRNWLAGLIAEAVVVSLDGGATYFWAEDLEAWADDELVSG